MSRSGGSAGPQQALSAIIGLLAFLMLLIMAGIMLLNALAPDRAGNFNPGSDDAERTGMPFPATWTPAAQRPIDTQPAAQVLTTTPVPSTTPLLPAATPAASPIPGLEGQIAFVSSRSGSGDLYLMAADGSGQSRLFLDQLRQDRPRLSPSGELIAFESRSSESPQDDAEVRVSDLDAALGFLLEDFARHASWSPDGDRLVLVRGSEIALVDADGGGSVVILNDPIGSPHLPVWSPEGDEIAYVRQEGDAQAIYLARVQDGGTSLVAVMPQFVEIGDLEWSPDGTSFLFCAEDRNSEVGVYGILYGGTGLQLLVADACDPTWAPDGAYFAFVADWEGPENIYVARPDGTVVRQLTRDQGQNYAPDWGVLPESRQ